MKAPLMGPHFHTLSSSHDVLISSKGTPDARQFGLILKSRFCASAEGLK
jgi:hypothetical protein